MTKKKKKHWSTVPTMHKRQEHGLSHTLEYTNWASMRNRCYNKKNKQNYARWGAKGIRVCPRWLVGENGVHPFVCFLADMGLRPSPIHQLDRYPNAKGNYEPGNVRWATPKEQGWSLIGTLRPDLATFNRSRTGKALPLKQRRKIAKTLTGRKRGPYKKKDRK